MRLKPAVNLSASLCRESFQWAIMGAKINGIIQMVNLKHLLWKTHARRPACSRVASFQSKELKFYFRNLGDKTRKQLLVQESHIRVTTDNMMIKNNTTRS